MLGLAPSISCRVRLPHLLVWSFPGHGFGEPKNDGWWMRAQ
jgi:hypothetical protein